MQLKFQLPKISNIPHSIWSEIVAFCGELASYNSRDAIRQLEYAGVTYVKAHAAFSDSGGSTSLFVTADDNICATVQADKILLATGSSPFRPGGIPFDGKRIFDSDSINTLSRLPKSVGKYSHVHCISYMVKFRSVLLVLPRLLLTAITGSGIVAIEFAKVSFFVYIL